MAGKMSTKKKNVVAGARGVLALVEKMKNVEKDPNRKLHYVSAIFDLKAWIERY